MAFYLTMVRTRKKLDKYFKINKIRNKVIIDVKKILEEENINLNEPESVIFFKEIILNKLMSSETKNKDIYYLPNFSNFDMDISKLIEIKKISEKYHDGFNLLLFFEEFISTNWLTQILDRMDEFDATQIIKDY